MNRVTFNLHEHGFRDRPLLSNWSPHHYIPNSPLSEEININHASKKDRNRYSEVDIMVIVSMKLTMMKTVLKNIINCSYPRAGWDEL